MNKFKEYLEKQQELFGGNKKGAVKTDLEHNKSKRFEWFKLLEKKLNESNIKEIVEIRKRFSGYSESLIKMDFKSFRLPKFGYEPKFNFKFSGNDIIFNVFPTTKIDSNNFNEIYKYIIKCSNFKSDFKSNKTQKSDHEDYVGVRYLPLKYDNLDKIKFRNTSLNEIGGNLISATITAVYKSFQDIWTKHPTIKDDKDTPVVIKSKHANSHITSISKKDNKVFFKVDEEMGRSSNRAYLTINDRFPWNLKMAYKKLGEDPNEIKDASFDLENGIIKITLKEDNNE